MAANSAALVQISTELIESQPDRYDLFVALDWDKIDQFAAEIPLDETTVIITDPEAGPVPAAIAKSKGKSDRDLNEWIVTQPGLNAACRAGGSICLLPAGRCAAWN